jgi:hypothetical protein
MKKKLLKKLGGYNPEFFPSSDYVLHANYSYNYNVLFINKKLNYYRIFKNESAKQETLENWEFLDNDIRKSFINKININNKILSYLNKLIQKNRVNGMIEIWDYKTNYSNKNYSIKEKIINKFLALKLYLNI